MARPKLKSLRELDNDDLLAKLLDLKADLSKLRSEAAKGTLKKQTGNIKYMRRDIARMLTIIAERKK